MKQLKIFLTTQLLVNLFTSFTFGYTNFAGNCDTIKNKISTNIDYQNGDIYRYETIIFDTSITVKNQVYKIRTIISPSNDIIITNIGRWSDNKVNMTISRNNCLIIDKEIKKCDFKSYINKNVYNIFALKSFNFYEISDSIIIFRVWIGEPDTDNENVFELKVLDTGSLEINEIDIESENEW
ncbi:MAG: DUF4738 domain-containing protein [Ignavibacteria bacterium]|nr:DUF4738 domain-containing protein [Ignavibacteria bacterium]